MDNNLGIQRRELHVCNLATTSNYNRNLLLSILPKTLKLQKHKPKTA
jgi:hypothetical protein